MKRHIHAPNWMRACAFVAMVLASGCDGKEDSGPPAAPSELSTKLLDGGVHVTWKDNSSNEVHFMLFRRMSHEDASASKEIATPKANETSFHDSMVEVGMSYSYKVQSMDADGVGSSFSNEVTIEVK